MKPIQTASLERERGVGGGQNLGNALHLILWRHIESHVAVPRAIARGFHPGRCVIPLRNVSARALRCEDVLMGHRRIGSPRPVLTKQTIKIRSKCDQGRALNPQSLVTTRYVIVVTLSFFLDSGAVQSIRLSYTDHISFNLTPWPVQSFR